MVQIILIILMYVQVEFIKTESLFTPWSEWSICDRICGLGSQRRVRLCQHASCIQNPLSIEKMECFHSCPTANGYDINRSSCETNHEILTHHAYNVNTGRKDCTKSSSVPMVILKFNSIIPFTVYHVYVNRDAPFSQIYLTYKHYGTSYPIRDFMPYRLVTEGSAKKVSLPIPKEVTELQVSSGRITQHYYGRFCYQCTVTGCHRPIVADMKILGALTVDTTKGSLPPRMRALCYTSFDRYVKYQNLMSVVNLKNNQKVPYDPSQPIYLIPVYSYGGTYRIELQINTIFIQQEFDCFEGEGMSYCLLAFSCNGRVQVIDGKSYGHYNPAFMLFKVIYDKDECLDSNIGCNLDHGKCVNTVGSFYCSCIDEHIGDGYSCYTPENWIKQKHGPYTTSMFQEFEIPDIYSRGFFHGNVSHELFACSKYQEGSPYGCLRSDDFGSTWKEIHPRLDIIIGQDLYTGRVFGYSTLDTAYIMFDHSSGRWYSIQKRQIDKLKLNGHLMRDKILMPTFKGSDPRRNENRFPLPQATMKVTDKTFAVTSHGLVRKLPSADKWEVVLSWENLPLQS